jgi:hypothetical protein
LEKTYRDRKENIIGEKHNVNISSHTPPQKSGKYFSQKLSNNEQRLFPLLDEFLQNAILDYVQSASMISASNLSRYLVNECGSPSETFSTGRFKIYPDVCKFLDYLAEQGIIQLLRKDGVNDRIYGSC